MNRTQNENPIYDHSKFLPNLFFSGIFCLVITIIFLIVDFQIFGWPLLPLYICGTLIGSDAILWFRGQIDTFDPKGLIGVVGLHFFFVSPILQIIWEIPLMGRVYEADIWLGWMGVINMFCILIYLLMSHIGSIQRDNGESVPQKTLRFNLKTAHVILIVAIVVCTIAQIYVFVSVGGFAGMIAAHEDAIHGSQVYFKTGVPRVLAQALPLLLLILVLTLNQKKFRKRSIWSIGFIFLVVFAIQFISTGLTGSRSSTLYGIVGVAGAVHYFWKKIRPGQVLLVMIPLIGLLYLYGFYKTAGAESFGLITGEVTVDSLSRKTGRTWEVLLLGDFSRAHLQAFELYKQVEEPGSYDLRYGKTYYTSVFAFIPFWIWPERPPQEKVSAGADLIFGRGWFYRYNVYRKSSNIYGLAGEAMLNFSWPFVFVVFGIWGFVVGRFRRSLFRIPKGDTRLVLCGLFSLLCLHGLINDVDNLLAFMLWKVSVVWVVVKLISVSETSSDEDIEG